MRIRRKKANKSKDGWILYLMANIPFFWLWKIGITGGNVFKRAKAVDKDAPGVPVPVFFIVVPGAYFIEQALHGLFFQWRTNYYDGDGHTEWFKIPAAPPTFLFMLFGWGVYAYLLSEVTALPVLDWYLDSLQYILAFIASLF